MYNIRISATFTSSEKKVSLAKRIKELFCLIAVKNIPVILLSTISGLLISGFIELVYGYPYNPSLYIGYGMIIGLIVGICLHIIIRTKVDIVREYYCFLIKVNDDHKVVEFGQALWKDGGSIFPCNIHPLNWHHDATELICPIPISIERTKDGVSITISVVMEVTFGSPFDTQELFNILHQSGNTLGGNLSVYLWRILMTVIDSNRVAIDYVFDDYINKSIDSDELLHSLIDILHIPNIGLSNIKNVSLKLYNPKTEILRSVKK
ncbi:MAG TPA: hypothetical protein PK367_00310 [Candidatus Paceibacterota bacterium]|nr:hypothetical protein [Candidatus Paceibacterota bacterium]